MNMKRGEIWMVSGDSDYIGKPRPAVILQKEISPDSRSVTICMLTADSKESPIPLPMIDPDSSNGISERSFLMVDKIVTVSRTEMRRKIGDLSPMDMAVLGRAVIDFWGLAASPAHS